MHKSEGFQTAILYATGICVATAINVITINQAIFGAFHIGGRIRIAVCSVVFRKGLRLSTTALGETAPGKVVNLVANDVNRFDLVSIFINHMWSAPLSAIIIGYFLWVEAGYAGLIGIAAVFIVVPVQSYTGKLSSKFRLQTAIKTDERVRLMDEIISGVQVIKMYAWEKPFCAMVELARRLELRVVRKSSYIRGIYMTFNLFTTRVALYCTLITMLIFHEDLTAEKVFVFSSYFNILAHTMSGMFVRGFAEIAECMVAVDRLQNFLMYEEVESGNTESATMFAASTDTMDSCDSRPSSRRFSKRELPYIDDDENHSEERDATDKKPNGVAVVANDVVKNSTNSYYDQRDGVYEGKWALKLTNVTAKWEFSQPENVLDRLNVTVGRGKLYVVIGAVGAGKSSLLKAILGEMTLSEGHVASVGSRSYASQEAWVYGGTVRENILFNSLYNRQRYQRVVKACALLRDFKQFSQGDQTIVGDRGTSLSGGQKARINLARAVYRQADIYLLDDPLSAVDTHVSKHLFEECIQRFLAGKTRILATHQLQYIKGVDGILLFERGKMRLFSNYHNLLAERPEYATLLASEETSETGDDSSFEKAGKMRRQFSTSSTRSRTPDVSGGDTDIEENELDPGAAYGMVEGTSRGVVQGSIFMKYLRSGGNLCHVLTVGVLFLITQLNVSLTDYFVPLLVTEEEHRHAEINKARNESELLNDTYDDANDFEPVMIWIYIYTGLVIGIFVIGITRSLLFYNLAMRASQRLHDLAFDSLIKTTMRFFDTNPSGRILNRFSKDLGALDELLPKATLDAGQIIMVMVGTLVVVCVVNPIFIIPIVVIAFIFYWIRKFYLKTSKNIKRLEGMTRSPVFTLLNATLNGLATIRAYGAENMLKRQFDDSQNLHTSAWYLFIVTSTAFGFSLDLFCFLFTSIVTYSFLLLTESFSGGAVGLAITQVMALTGIIQWGMRQSAEVANQLMAVERVLEYTALTPEENLRDVGIGKKKNIKNKEVSAPAPSAPSNWPTDGCIRFSDVYMRYSEEDEPVLRGLSFVLPAQYKVGIVGRTGAGKSSLIAALFRLAKVEGVIDIDGVDTGSICLEDLRRHISIIPQDPVLFSGTMRRNLDPFNEFTDDALWAVLEEVELKEATVAGGNGLESRVHDRGSNYSAGQRQLICLARAILKNNKILMLDEATANVDPQTDALIQRTIRTKFARCTVLTVAHRLNTIMDSDKVLLMDRGRLREYDHPHILLQNPQSQFSSMVRETGRAMTEQLMRVAKQAYVAKYGERL
ncbi:ATP-binding cassette subfamily C member 4-like isoform X2 [Venturia canescens]|nr:ATP-binding cassette subfamily C member 4-like isoform X2 [Venturia canescens]